MTAMDLYATLDVSLESTSVYRSRGHGRSESPDVVARRLASHRLRLSASRSTGAKVGSSATAPSAGVSMTLTPAAGGGATGAETDVDDGDRVIPPWLLGELPDQGRPARPVRLDKVPVTAGLRCRLIALRLAHIAQDLGG